MKQLGLGNIMYNTDYDGQHVRYFRALDLGYVFNDGVSFNRMTFMSCIMPYVKNSQIYTCPSCTPTPKYENAANWGDGYYESAYAYNTYWGGFGVSDLRYVDDTLNNDDPARIMMMCEWDASYHACHPPWLRTNLSESELRHNGGMNMAFADGHAKWVQYNVLAGGFDAYGLMNN